MFPVTVLISEQEPHLLCNASCVYVSFHFETLFFKLLTHPVPWLSPQERAAFPRVRPPSTSPPLSPLPLSWKAFTRVHWAPWAPWQTVGALRGERGFSEDLPPHIHQPGTEGKGGSGPKPFKAELFCLCTSCLPAAFSSWRKCTTLFFPFNFFHPNWKNCSGHFSISRRGPLPYLHLHVNARLLHAKICHFSAIVCAYASNSL